MDRSQSEASNVLALEAQSRAAARAAGLRYTDDRRPGLRRERKRKEFHYLDQRGHRISDSHVLARLRALAIPPAWTDVWICPHENGHLQATGRDARGRKQYRYHRRWSETRDAAKHSRMCEFARRLDEVRSHCARVLRTRGLTREKLMAALLRIVDLTAIRVGHEEYVRDNDSFGLTTLRTRHARVRGATVELRFRGKSGIQRTITFRDPALAKLVVACRKLGGPHLFQYRDRSGCVRGIDATQLNGYLHSLIGSEFSVKDFRTWSATVCVAVELSATQLAASQRAAKKQLLQAIRTASGHLGNTPAICRKSYVHPLIMDAYLIGKTLHCKQITNALPGGVGYQAHERAVRRFLLRLIRESSRK
ncbi:MAG TPA: DNA topoisomerase IB, partial [Polyangiales bacterium]